MEPIKIIADNRERSRVIQNLSLAGAVIEFKQLPVGDFIVSDKVGIERKEVNDFLSSLLDGRLFEQVANLTRSFEKPILLIEGTNLFGARNIHPNAITGSLASIAIDFRLPILWATNADEAAQMIYRCAYREQVDRQSSLPAIRNGKPTQSLKNEQEFLLCGLPNISTLLARRLLEKFETPLKVFNASDEVLQTVEGIGTEKAKKIRMVLDSK